MKEIRETDCKVNENSRHWLVCEFPFFRYSITAWILHAEIVEAENLPQGDLLSLFQWPSNQLLQCWIHLHGILDLYSERRPCTSTTLLHLASRYDFTSFVEIVLNSDNKINANSKDDDGRTPLSCAAESGHDTVVRLLLERNDVKTDSKDVAGQTPLSLAANLGHDVVVRLPLERRDIQADVKNRNGRTPLSWAAESGHEAVVRLLLERNNVDA